MSPERNGAPREGVQLEGWMLKRATHRKKQWNRRYFTLSGNNFAYYEKEEHATEKPKASFVVSNDSGCEVGGMYIDQCNEGGSKKLLYCIKITWSSGNNASIDGPAVVQESAPGTTSQALSPVATPGMTTPRRSGLTTPRRRSSRSRAVSPSVSQELRHSFSLEEDAKDATDKKKQRRNPRDSDNRALGGQADIDTSTSSRRSYTQDEKELMHSLYEATKKANRRKTKKKILNGGKVAAATGAVVTISVVTVGVGLLAGLAVLGIGAAAGGTGMGAAGFSKRRKRNDGVVILASSSYEEVRKWKSALDACLALESARVSTWGHMFSQEGRNTSTALLPSGTRTGIWNVRSHDSDESDEFTSGNTKFKVNDEMTQNFVDPEIRWVPMEGGWAAFLGAGAQGLRVFREERQEQMGVRRANLSFEGRPCAPVKAQLVLNESPLDTFMCLMSCSCIPASSGDLPLPLVPKSGQRASFRVIETIDDHMDVIHLFFHPLYLFPSWTTARDFVLFRYWRLERDGTYVVCCDSVQHNDCPPYPGYTRGEMHSVHTISPRKKHATYRENIINQECLLTSVVQVDPRGWVPTMSIPLLSNQSYADAFGVASLLQLLDIRDALDNDRFVPVSLGPERPGAIKERNADISFRQQLTTLEKEMGADHINLSLSLESSGGEDDGDIFSYDYKYSARESIRPADSVKGIAMSPKPLPAEKWAQPDANSFRVRGKTYKRDRNKINAGLSIGRLVAVDVVQVEKAIFSGFCMHPTERVQLALAREKRLKEKGLESDFPAFLFVVNIVLPGPPYYHGVFYYAIDDMSTIDGTDGTPSSKLCNKFFFGDSDKFRDDTFKLIPMIVEGNFLVRKAVGSTPAIMGTKLRQLYVRSDRFCEVVLDCGSSSVATGVIRLSLGYAKTLVVDMGFLFEGNDDSTLPERIFGCARIKKLQFGKHLRLVPQPPPPAKAK